MDESGESNFLIDGFPRNDENLNGWNASTLAEKVSYNYSYSFNTIGKSEGTYKVATYSYRNEVVWTEYSSLNCQT